MGVDERMAVVSEGVGERVALGPEECDEAGLFAVEPTAEGDDASADAGFEGIAVAVGTGSVFGRVAVAEPDADAAEAGGFGECEGDGSGREPLAGGEPAPPANSRIRSTIAGSRLARTLGLTSRFHFWIRSTSSGPFNPSSLANSWTRVDNGDSS